MHLVVRIGLGSRKDFGKILVAVLEVRGSLVRLEVVGYEGKVRSS